MALVYNVEEAASWSDEEAARILQYAESRGRFNEVNRIIELRGGTPVYGETGVIPAEGSDEWFENATAKEIAAWVGEDRERAALALDKEGQRDDPRSGLTARLEKLTE